MIIYNVTCHLDQNLAVEWLDWMIQYHIPEVMETRCFTEYKILKVLTNFDDDNGVNYSVQYMAKSMQDYEKYLENHAPALQQKTREKYGEKVLAFRTLLEVIA